MRASRVGVIMGGSSAEKEVSLLLRSRLGEDLYRQIAYTNPREFLNIEMPAPKQTVRKKTAREPRPPSGTSVKSASRK